jgi:hypothetical protein
LPAPKALSKPFLMDDLSLLRDFHSALTTRYPIDGENMAMGEWLVRNTHLAGEAFSFEGYEFQQQIADDMHPDLACIKCSQVGLALALDTPVPTPTGWATMGDLTVGDAVFDEQGAPCTITYVSPVFTDHPCYRVTFDTGDEIIADAQHRWYVEADRAFNLTGDKARGRPVKGTAFFKSGVLSTEQIARFHKNGGRNRFAIPNTAALQAPTGPLPVDPYFMGLWLSDGNSHGCFLTAIAEDARFYEAELLRRGLFCEPSSDKNGVHQFAVRVPGQTNRPGRGVPNSLSSRLSDLGLLKGAKFIPPGYLRGSLDQRLDLLRGLLDTDGSATKRGRVSFYNTDPALIEGVRELAHSLGYKTRTRWRMHTPSFLKNGHVITPRKPLGEVSFAAYGEHPVFLLPRKRERLNPTGRRSEGLRRRIVGVDQITSVPTRCISVDSASHLFLAGEGMIPTHNTEVQIRKFLGWLKRHRGTTGIFTLPSEKLFKRISKMRIKPLIESETVFNQRPLNDAKPARSMDMYQIDESFAVISGLTEDDATSTSADILFHDEVDLSDQAMLALAQSRLQNSDYKITQGFSTPKWPGYGIDAKWAISDQHDYFLKCSCCGHQQVPDFNMKFMCLPGYTGPVDPLEASNDEIQAINFDEAFLKCERCSKPVDLRRPELRQWVDKHPGRLVRGYRVAPFSTYRLPLRYVFSRLLSARAMTGVQGFHNTVLGKPYVDSKAQLSESEIRKCLGQPRNLEVGSDVPCFIGIDVGDTCHITLGPIVGDKAGTAVVQSVTVDKLIARLDELMAAYNIIGGTIDRHPYTPTANAIRDRYHNRIIPVEYRGTAACRLVLDEAGNVSHAQVDRTGVLDKVVDAIRGGMFEIDGYGAQESILIEHLRNMVREEEPEQPAKWVKLSTSDHYFHALAFMLVAPRVMTLIQEHMSDEMMTSVGIFDIASFSMGGAVGIGGNPDFQSNNQAPALSVRARTKMRTNLWP